MKRVARIGTSLKTSTQQENKYECNECKDVGWIIDKDGKALPCKCQEVKRYKEILKNCGISEAFLKKTFENYTAKTKMQKEAKAAATKYVKDFLKIRNESNNSIAFIGKVGTGKTHLTIAITNELMKQLIGVLYMQYREDITKLKQNMTDEEYYQRKMDRFKNAPVLFIDDLFKGRITDSDISLMYEIINHRYLKSMPIIFSCEFGMDKLLDFDEAIGSRIAEMCRGRIIYFDKSEKNFRLI